MAQERVFAGASGVTWRWYPGRQLGTSGGFGGVYEGTGDDSELVAVKVVPRVRRGREPLDERLLRREVEIGKRVQELGPDALALPVLDAAEDEEALFFVMARAESALASRPLPLSESEAIAVLTEIASGLQQLHSIGIIHRDLKPANILRHDKRWKLADFGIARDEEIGTQSATFIGWGSTPYMAPELWKMQSPTVKTDLYALGCLAYELLAGQPPYNDGSDDIRDAHLQKSVPVAPSDNTIIRTLIARLLAKEPGERPQDARAVVERLERAALARTPQLEAIARGLAVHDQELSAEAIARSEAEAAAEAHRHLIAQAKADLDEMFQDGLIELHDINPDATYDPRQSALALDGTWLLVKLWNPNKSPVPKDTMAQAGAVMLTNRRRSKPFLAANVVYEKRNDGRWVWNLYRFRANAFGHPGQYRFGPYDRLHGFDDQIFLNQTQRSYMVQSPGLHVWQATVEQLASDILLRLFQEAVDLQAAVSQDPRW